jgi:hypothetical protein
MTNHYRTRWKNKLISWIPWISDASEARHLFQAATAWKKEGWTTPPPYFVRRAMLLSEARATGADIFVETGTFLGGTTWSFRKKFRRIYTVEVEPGLATLARERFNKWPSVTLIEGDSATKLPEICRELDAPCLFYLDGHYSGGFTGRGDKDSPIIEELNAIFTNTNCPFRIVIDDARLFGVDPSYPSLADIERLLSTKGKRVLRIENDAIIIS